LRRWKSLRHSHFQANSGWFFCIGWQKSSPCKFFASFFFRCWNFSSSCLWPQLSRIFSASRDSRFSSLRSFLEKQLS
jgi:hypothetical protein